jgi:hypothetical protein
MARATNGPSTRDLIDIKDVASGPFLVSRGTGHAVIKEATWNL